jgi:hypothetical protein
VKLPKRLRRAAAPLLAYANQPLVSDTLAAALVAGATALVDKKGARGAIKAAGLGAGVAAVKASKGSNRVGLALLIALAEAAAGALVASGEKGKAERKG